MSKNIERANEIFSPKEMLPHFLDYSRGVAALLVLLFHARAALFLPFAQFQNHSFPSVFFYTATAFGHSAVVIFFVLSGFLVGGLGMRLKWPLGVANYGLNRFIRILPVTTPAILFSAGLVLFERNTIGNTECTVTNLMLFENLLNLQGFGMPVLCNNYALWSISNEVFYYIAFPVFFAYISGNRSIKLLIFAILCIFSLVYSLVWTPLDDRNVALYFLIWLTGLLPWFSWFPKLNIMTAISYFIMVLLLGTAGVGGRPIFILDVAIGLAFALLIRSFIHTPVLNWTWGLQLKRIINNIFIQLSSISFSLYVTHYPIVRLFADWTGRSASDFSWDLLARFITVIFISLLVAKCFSMLFEAPRKWYREKLDSGLTSINESWLRHR